MALQQLDQPFTLWLKSIQLQMEDVLSATLMAEQDTPDHLMAAMRYAALDGGKRIRPLLVFAAGELFDAPEAVLSRAAAAIEMIHVYSLVHDDMPCMDDDDLRRNKPTVHVKYDEATALLVGDALQSQAFSVLSASLAPSLVSVEQQLHMVQILAHAAGAAGMCGGQAIDLASVGKMLTQEALEHMHRLKTGALLSAAVLLGAIAGKTITTEEKLSLQHYASAVGLAFQVVDDILDVTADSATLGKTAGKDAVDHKPTYVSILGLETSRQLAEQLRLDAHQALSGFGDKAQRLKALADFVVQRQA